MTLRRFAIMSKNNTVVEMHETTAVEMNELLKGKAGTMQGVPAYFDPAGRVWPAPTQDWVVAEELDEKDVVKNSAAVKVAEATAAQATFAKKETPATPAAPANPGIFGAPPPSQSATV